jgi:hypothetical protein
MYTWDDILIVGDSFCANRGREYEWPQQLVCELTGESYAKGKLPRGEGFPGASWWSTRNAFLEEIKHKPVKLVIVCHTEFSRVPNDENLPLNAASHRNYKDREIGKAVEYYYGYLYSHNFHKWSQQAWYHEIESVCKEHNIRAVHIHCFESDYVFKEGLTVKEIWMHHAIDGSCNPFYTDISNHFAPVTNQRLGQNLAKLIKQWNGKTGTVTGTLFNDSGFEIKGLQ